MSSLVGVMMAAFRDLQDLGRAAMIVDRYPPKRLFRLVPDLPPRSTHKVSGLR
jgi:hypothetical protein